jgi:hypothetical protein
METIQDYLHKDPEVMPDWLGRYRPGDRFNRELFFSGRTVFYNERDLYVRQATGEDRL